MNKTLTWKLVLILAILVVFTLGIFGPPWAWSGNGPLEAVTDRIHLGLDLKGGTHLILQVQVNDAVNVDSDNAIARLKEDLRAHKINYADIIKPDPANHPEMIVIKGVAPEQRSDLQTIVAERLPEYNLTSGAENSYALSMKAPSLSDLKNRAVAQAIETIRNRIDALGVSEPVIQEHGLGQYQILVQLPGVDDPARVKDIIKSTAMLEIKQSMGGPYSSQAQAYQELAGKPDAVVLPGRSIGRSDETGETWYLISRAAAVTGGDLRDAQPGTDDNGQPEVKFTLSGEGGRKFYSFTSAHVGDSLAVVLDGKVQEVANIRDAIRDSGVITGRFTQEQTRDLSLKLRSGALPASINYLEERTVGPSLGADSIRSGVRAAIVGMVAVLVFMLVYYRGAGINADIALVLNLIILLGFMGYFGAVLTLPGIAGVILTVGMGVDSNVLIFERIREELRNGKTPPSAVDQGFNRAWTTILDTHVTTIVSALILFVVGTGPVSGFGLSLIFSVAGILSMIFWHGIPLGVEFRGGTRVYVKFTQTPNNDEIRALLAH